MAKKITKTGFEAKRKALFEQMKSLATPFAEDTAERKAKRIARAKIDEIYFLQTYFPHYVTRKDGTVTPTPPYHYDLVELAKTDNVPVSITAPRGGAKSVINTFTMPLHGIYFPDGPNGYHFGLIISDTTELAADFIEFIKLEIEENDRLKADFGELKGERQWKTGDIVTKNGIRILARSYGTRVNGLRHGAHRPDRVWIDDFENPREQNNPKNLERKERWIKAVVIPGLDPDNWRLIYVGTLLSNGSVLARFMDKNRSPEWKTANFEATDANFTYSFWPERFPTGYLAQMKRTMGEVLFNREMRGIAVDDDTAMFRRQWMQRKPLTRELIDSCRFVVTYTDASAGSGESNDFKAIITVGWNGGQYVVLHAWIRHATISAMLDRLYTNHILFRATCHGMEEIAFQSLFRELLPRVGAEKGYQIPMRFRKGLTQKETRVGGMSPLFEGGHIIIAESSADAELDAGDMDILMEQLTYFPNSAVNDDGPDALEGAVWLAQQLGAGYGGSWGEYESTGIRRAGYFDEEETRRKIAVGF